MSYRDIEDRSLRARGIRWTLARSSDFADRSRGWILRREGRMYEQAVNIDTTGSLQTEDATIPEGKAADGTWYDPSALRIVRWWMSAMPAQLDQFTFLDLGSGKGRVLFVAAQQGFRRVIGVEYALELHTAAQENLRRSTLPEKDRIELVLGDAGTFEFPPDPLIIYGCNPFNETVMARVIENLTRSYESLRRPIVIVYEQHRHEPPRTKFDNVRVLASVPYLNHRPLTKPRVLDRVWLLQPYLVDMFESSEARQLQ